jgi:hypothetical protein
MIAAFWRRKVNSKFQLASSLSVLILKILQETLHKELVAAYRSRLSGENRPVSEKENRNKNFDVAFRPIF